MTVVDEKIHLFWREREGADMEEAVDNCVGTAGDKDDNKESSREARLSKKGKNNLTVPQQQEEAKWGLGMEYVTSRPWKVRPKHVSALVLQLLTCAR